MVPLQKEQNSCYRNQTENTIKGSWNSAEWILLFFVSMLYESAEDGAQVASLHLN